jgi:hypothetical protein
LSGKPVHIPAPDAVHQWSDTFVTVPSRRTHASRKFYAARLAQIFQHPSLIHSNANRCI